MQISLMPEFLGLAEDLNWSTEQGLAPPACPVRRQRPKPRPRRPKPRQGPGPKAARRCWCQLRTSSPPSKCCASKRSSARQCAFLENGIRIFVPFGLGVFAMGPYLEGQGVASCQRGSGGMEPGISCCSEMEDGNHIAPCSRVQCFLQPGDNGSRRWN